MTIETATFLAALDATKPLNTDLVAEGDDHLRLLKAVLQATFPGRGVGEKAPLSRIAPFTPGLSEISALFVANGATQADLPAVSGLPGGTHYWFWAADNDLLLTTLDTTLINGGATLTLEQGTGACVVCTGSGWAAIGLGSGGSAVNLTAGTGISITGTYPDLTVASTLDVPDQVNLTAGTYASVTGDYPDLVVDAVPLNAGYSSPVVISGSYPDLTWSLNAQPSCVFKTTKTDDQTLTSGGSVKYRVDWNSAIYDTEGALTALSHTFIAPIAGYYQVNILCCYLPASSSGSLVRLYLHKNLTEIEVVVGLLSATETLHAEHIQLSSIIQLDVDETLSVYMSNQTALGSVIGSQSYFSGHLIPLGLV